MEIVHDERIAFVGHIEHLSPGARKLRDFYDLVPGAPIYQAEFGYYCMDRWKREGHVTDDTDLAALFGFDPPGEYSLEHPVKDLRSKTSGIFLFLSDAIQPTGG